MTIVFERYNAKYQKIIPFFISYIYVCTSTKDKDYLTHLQWGGENIQCIKLLWLPIYASFYNTVLISRCLIFSTGGRMGRFDSGYVIMNSLLSNKSALQSLPLEDIWSYLLFVACKQTGQHRLKCIELLLRVLQSSSDLQLCPVATDGRPVVAEKSILITDDRIVKGTFMPGSNGNDTDLSFITKEKDERRALHRKTTVDLTLLQPLWLLYSKLQKDQVNTGYGILPPLIHALTELFFVAESRAQEWDVVKEYLISVQDHKLIIDTVLEGAKNIAAIGVAIGYQNIASDPYLQKLQSLS